MLDLAKHNRVWHAEVQPFPYMRELVLRQKIAETRDDLEKAVFGLLKLQAVVPEASEGSGRFIYDDTILDRMQERFGVNTFEACAALMVQKLVDAGDVGLDHDHIGIYGTLLKMIDVGLQMKASTREKKLSVIDHFIVDEMHAIQPRLFVLARLFFRGTLARLLKMGSGDAKFERKHLIGSSFDLHLTTIHEKFLADSEAPEGWLSILCTLDQGLAEYAGRFPTQSIAVMKDHSSRIAHSWDDVWLKSVLGEDHSEVIASINARIPSPRTRRLSTDIIETIRDLEAKLGVGPELSLLGDAAPERIKAQKRP